MPEAEQPLSQVIPVLVAILVCDVAVQDPSTGKKSLIGIFDQVNVKSFPSQRPVSVYIKVADADGRYKLEVRFIHQESNEVLAELKGELRIGDRLKSADFYVSTPPLPIPGEGRYEFQVWANGVYLGGTIIAAQLAEKV